MSPLRRTSWFSIARWPSRRLRSRMSTWDSVGLDQIAGSESFDSKADSSLSMRSWSKILPKVADFFAYRSVGEFEFVQHDLVAPQAKPDRDGNYPQGDYPTQVSKQIAVHCVEGLIGTVAVSGGQRSERVALHAGSEPAVRIDDRGDPGVGIAKQPAAIFNGAHSRYVERLPGRTRVAIPAIIGNIDQHFRSVFREQAYFVAENFLVADEDTKAMAASRKDHAPPAVGHVASLLGQVPGEGEKVLIRDVLSPGNEVDLVVTTGHRAISAHEECGVVHVVAGPVRVQRGGAGDHWRMHVNGEITQSLQQARILIEKGCG